MSDAQISIIMPVRNGLPYLEDCINSIVNQQQTNWQLIIVDDHSTDNTLEILQNFAKNDTRIKIYKNRGKGIIDALSLGYSQSSGEYITRMDADDIMPANKLQVLIDLLSISGLGHISTGHVKYFSNTAINDGYKSYEEWLNSLCTNNSHFEDIYKECVIPSPCWMVHRQDFERIGGFNSSIYPEDYDLCFRMYKYGLNVASSDDVLHMWRDHGARASRNDQNYADNRFLDIKLKYFLEIEHSKQPNITLLGAGKKGKYIAKHLTDLNIQFEWFTNNLKKIGKDIYGTVLLDFDSIQNNLDTNFVITIANKQEQGEVKSKLRHVDLARQYWFC